MTANQFPSDNLGVEDISPARLHGEACIECGSADAPLHPAGTVTIPDGDIDHVYDTVVCTEHLVLNR